MVDFEWLRPTKADMDQNIFFSQQEADHVAGDRARTLLSRMETSASSLIIFFIFFHI